MSIAMESNRNGADERDPDANGIIDAEISSKKVTAMKRDNWRWRVLQY